MAEQEWDVAEQKLLAATLRVVDDMNRLLKQNSGVVEDASTSEDDNEVLNNEETESQANTEHVNSHVNPSEQMELAKATSIPKDHPKPPPLIPISMLKSNIEESPYFITFYFEDGEVRVVRFGGEVTYSDILFYLKSGKYYLEDWSSIYCDIRCREPRMNLGKMKEHQTLSQAKLPYEFSVDVKIKKLFD